MNSLYEILTLLNKRHVRLLLYFICGVVLCQIFVINNRSGANNRNSNNVHSYIPKLTDGEIERLSEKQLQDQNNAKPTPKQCKKSKIAQYLVERQLSLETACTTYGHLLPPKWQGIMPTSGMLNKLRWDKGHNLIYCHVPKVASTTWSWYLLRGVGISDEKIKEADNVHILLNNLLPGPLVDDREGSAYTGSFKFIVVRHPYERLVSAYQNKIADRNNRRLQYRNLQKIILQKYRGPGDYKNTSIVPTFPEFTDYVISELETWLSKQTSEKQTGKQLPDHHWLPISYICSPCQIHYDVISKLETINEDADIIANSCGLQEIFAQKILLNESPILKNNKNLMPVLEKAKIISRINSASELDPPKINNNQNSLYKKYFNQLPNNVERRLYKIYELDFRLFNYTVNL